jgi:saccharopine dehydrogenase (NADP+, L-glutamate forming)
MLRGTFRNFGWCETLKAIADLGVLKDDSVKTGITALTPAQWLRQYAPGTRELRHDIADRLGMKEDDTIMDRFAWLGLFDEKPIGLEQGSNLDILAKQMLDRMAFKPGERDMVVLHHEFLAEYPAKPAERIFSTLIAFGEPGGDSSMARTVSLPAAIGARMILQGELKLTGVQIPVVPEIYQPVLAELAGLGIECKERKAPTS